MYFLSISLKTLLVKNVVELFTTGIMAFSFLLKKVNGTKYTMWKFSDSTGYEYPGRFICYVDGCWNQKRFYEEHGNKSFNKRNSPGLPQLALGYIYIYLTNDADADSAAYGVFFHVWSRSSHSWWCKHLESRFWDIYDQVLQRWILDFSGYTKYMLIFHCYILMLCLQNNIEGFAFFMPPQSQNQHDTSSCLMVRKVSLRFKTKPVLDIPGHENY